MKLNLSTVPEAGWPNRMSCFWCEEKAMPYEKVFVSRGPVHGTVLLHVGCVAEMAWYALPSLKKLASSPGVFYDDTYRSIRDHIRATKGHPFGSGRLQQEKVN